MKLRTFVITIETCDPSLEAARRCVESARQFGVDCEVYSATTPDDRPVEKMNARSWSTDKFHNRWCRFEPACAAFLSHARLWEQCAGGQDPFLILEHDAVFVSPLPEARQGKVVCNYGKPSFGQFDLPASDFGPLSSGRYFKGTHAVYVTPAGAGELLQQASDAEPVDVFLSSERFPWLTEVYPWPIECHDSVSTIQKPLGCRTKHNPVRPI